MSHPPIIGLLHQLNSHEQRARTSINFTPSENVLSPLAKLPLIMDVYSRYFFDHMKLFGEWFFFGGIEAGRIQLDYLEPLLREMSRASCVDVRPISGLNCMTIVMAALCRPGHTMYTVPESSGGHMSTSSVAHRLGIRTVALPMLGHRVDLDQLAEMLRRDCPDLIYIDLSTQLFPIDPQPIRNVIDAVAPEVVLHYDSSHINGLILADALPNPLERGAHIFGGSTHKTLPGPHKGFLSTNDAGLARRIDAIAYHYVSHHQVAAAISLCITLMELQACNGQEYARRTLHNAQLFARGLAANGIKVAGSDMGFTACHQVWASPRCDVNAQAAAMKMYEFGLLVNVLPTLPGIGEPSFRLSLAEVTRLGATDTEILELVEIFSVFLTGQTPRANLRNNILSIRERLHRPRYCYTSEQLAAMGAPDPLLDLIKQIE